jgi:hypothetical protein
VKSDPWSHCGIGRDHPAHSWTPLIAGATRECDGTRAGYARRYRAIRKQMGNPVPPGARRKPKQEA